MGAILSTVEQWLKSDDWNYDKHPEDPLIRCGVQGNGVTFRLYFQAREEQDQLLLYVVGPNLVPEDKRTAVMEFLTRVNYGLVIGNFELDLSDGEVRYKVSVDVEGSKLVPIMVKNLIGAGVTMMDRYYPGLMAVAYGGKSPLEAIKDVDP